MKSYYQDKDNVLYCGDNLEVMPQLEDNSIDTILTDPPYALSFMGQSWDKVLPAKEIWVECLRVAKPGAMMLVFGGDRTHHRLMCAIEDAGWEIRTCVYWIFGSGFPKSLDISKAIDKMGINPMGWIKFSRKYAELVAKSKYNHNDIDKHLGIKASSCYWARIDHRGGLPPQHHWESIKGLLGISNKFDTLYDEAEREIIGTKKVMGKDDCLIYGKYKGGQIDITAPATPEAQLWDGWASGLKPAVEIIVLAMKPLDGTFAQNALKWGVGGLNIDGGRIGTEVRNYKGSGAQPHKLNAHGKGDTGIGYMDGSGKDMEFQAKGRYPSNLFLSHSPECRQTGMKKVKGSHDIGKAIPTDTKGVLFGQGKDGKEGMGYSDPNGTETIPAYECVEGCPVKMLDEQAGELKSGGGQKQKGGDKINPCGWVEKNRTVGDIYKPTSGGASRFFYTAKSSRSEREAGLKGHIPCVKCGGLDTDFHLDDKGDKVKCVRNDHPTVKPQAILDYLCKLTMTPTGGVVLDMFGGTGTTALACEKIGRKCILIEKEKKFCDIAVARLKGLTKQGRLWDA